MAHQADPVALAIQNRSSARPGYEAWVSELVSLHARDRRLRAPAHAGSTPDPWTCDPRKVRVRGRESEVSDPGHPESAPPAARIRSPSMQASIAGHPCLRPRIARPGDRSIVAIPIAFHDLAVAGASLCGSAREPGGPASRAIQDPSSHLPSRAIEASSSGHRSFVGAACRLTSLDSHSSAPRLRELRPCRTRCRRGLVARLRARGPVT